MRRWCSSPSSPASPGPTLAGRYRVRSPPPPRAPGAAPALTCPALRRGLRRLAPARPPPPAPVPPRGGGERRGGGMGEGRGRRRGRRKEGGGRGREEGGGRAGLRPLGAAALVSGPCVAGRAGTPPFPRRALPRPSPLTPRPDLGRPRGGGGAGGPSRRRGLNYGLDLLCTALTAPRGPPRLGPPSRASGGPPRGLGRG